MYAVIEGLTGTEVCVEQAARIVQVAHDCDGQRVVWPVPVPTNGLGSGEGGVCAGCLDDITVCHEDWNTAGMLVLSVEGATFTGVVTL